jgi:hypothetical protein
MNRNHRGQYRITGDYTALKVMAASVVLCLLVKFLDWGKILPAKAEFISPVSDAKVIEVPVIKYVIPQTVQDEICSVFGKDCADAIRVFTCESGLRPSAHGVNTNGSTDTGIAQINSVHSIPEKYLKNQHVNIQIAYQIFQEQHWAPWTCARKLGIH